MGYRISSALPILALLCAPALSAAPSHAPTSLDHTVIQCSIYGKAGEILRNFPYRACVFLDNGSLIVADRSGVGLLDEKLAVKWFLKTDTHHQLKLSNDGKRIFVMSSEMHRWKGEKTRFDTLLILSMEGKILKKFDFFDQRSFFSRNGFPIKNIQEIDMDMRRDPDVRQEFSHANSIHEIGPNAAEKKDKAFAEGNFLVNDNQRRMVFIIDKNLKKILWAMPQDREHRKASFHDVQLTAEGKLLVYRNRTPNSLGIDYSTLVEIDPITGSENILFERSPPQSFYSPFCGGIQRLPSGNLLFDDYTKGAVSIEIDKSGKEIRSVHHHRKNKDTGLPEVYQESKRFDLTSFLKNNIGL